MTITKKMVRGAHSVKEIRKSKSRSLKRGPMMFRLSNYTEKQLRILRDEISIDDLRLNELTVLIKKAADRGDEDILSKATELRELVLHKDDIPLKYTAAEIEQVMSSLEPEWLRDLKRRVKNNPAAPFDHTSPPEPSSKSTPPPPTPKRMFKKFAVEQYTEDWFYVGEFDSVSSAAKAVGKNVSSISRAISNKRLCAGFYWIRKE